MKLKNLFILHSVIALSFGIGSIVIPHPFMSLFGTTLEPTGALMMQFGGAWLIGIGLLTWLMRNVSEIETQQSIAIAFLVMSLLAFIVALLGQINGTLNILGWLPVAINLVLSLGYAYILFAAPKVSGTSSLTQHPQH